MRAAGESGGFGDRRLPVSGTTFSRRLRRNAPASPVKSTLKARQLREKLA